MASPIWLIKSGGVSSAATMKVITTMKTVSQAAVLPMAILIRSRILFGPVLLTAQVRQNVGVIKTSSVKISRRPSNMATTATSFPVGTPDETWKASA